MRVRVRCRDHHGGYRLFHDRDNDGVVGEVNEGMDSGVLIADDLRLFAHAALVATPTRPASPLVVMAAADAGVVPVVAVRPKSDPLEGADPHRRVLHEYRQQERASQSDGEHAGIISGPPCRNQLADKAGSISRLPHL